MYLLFFLFLSIQHLSILPEKLIFICKKISADATTHPPCRPLEQVDGNKRDTEKEGDKTW